MQAGDLVIAPFLWSDGTCAFCARGLQTSCVAGGGYGAPDDDGQDFVINISNPPKRFVRAYVDKEGSAALESDLIVSGGVPQENVEVFIQTFRNVVGKWARFLLDRKK